MRTTRIDGGWWEVRGLDGWETSVIGVRVEVVNGLRQVVGIRVEPAEGAKPEPITTRTLRALPVGALPGLLAARDFALQPEQPWVAAAQEVAKRAEDKRRDPRAVTTVEKVAAAWNAAYREGVRNKREVVCRDLTIQTRTYDRYLKEARQRGLTDDVRGGSDSET